MCTRNKNCDEVSTFWILLRLPSLIELFLGYRYPAHELISGASKIPTVIYYDVNGKVKAVGAEAMREGIQDLAEDRNWVKVEWFVLSSCLFNYKVV